MKTFNDEVLEQHAQMILDAINDDRITDEMIRDNEVHQEVFNTDYFIIGYYEAEKWIDDNFDSLFHAIEIVREYEIINFGEFTTELNSEKIANRLSYMCGEQVISELSSFDSVKELTESLNDYLN